MTLENAVNTAHSLYAQGYDDVYISIQLSEEKYSAEIIEEVISRIKKIRKSQKRKSGIRRMIAGVSIAGTSIIFSYVSTQEGSPIVFILYGTAFIGSMIFVKGFLEFLNW